MDTAPEGDGLSLKNRLEESRSPYVRGHSENPVAWQIWDTETLALAKKHNRLLFVSIGYAACHWCHVMERESFMSAEIANLLNASFIPVKVDREERPDVDSIYMNYVQATTGTGGWPLNVFLTPDLQPVFGGTYFPGPNSAVAYPLGSETVGLAGILEKMRDVWANQEKKCRESAQEATKQLKGFAEEGVHGHNTSQPGILELELLEEAYRTISHSYDSKNGGLSAAPKFPVPVKLRFLLQLGQWPQPIKDILGVTATVNAASMAATTLRKMARGGIRDHVGYGFARYSVTTDWSLPHFEKMLYDQALLLDSYLDAFLTSHDAEMLGAVYDIATYLTSPPISRQGGGFFASEDADSAPSRTDTEKREGAFYVWTRKALHSVLDKQQADIVARFYGIYSDGNVPREHDPHDDFLNQNVLSIVSTPAALSKDLGIPESDIVTVLKDARRKMRNYREKDRPKPSLDDKVVVAWNGLAIAALARASSAILSVDPGAAKFWLESAVKAATFIKNEMYDAKYGILWRVWRESRGGIRGLADDYAGMISGAIELYTATFNCEWLEWADSLMKYQIRDFWAPDGGFYTAPHPADGAEIGHGDLLLRLKSGMDNAEPSSNALSAMNLCRLASFLNDEELEQYARKTTAAFEAEIDQWPGSFPGLLSAVAWLGTDSKSVWIVGPDEASGSPFALDEVLARLHAQLGVARTILRIKGAADEAFLRERNSLVGALEVKTGELKVIVCEKGACKDVQKVEEL